MREFTAPIEIIGINPYVSVPTDVLQEVFREAGKDKGPIPVSGLLNGQLYRQTLVKYQGAWRLYINTIMLKDSPKRITEVVTLTVGYDSRSREIPVPQAFTQALKEHPQAQEVFNGLNPSLQKEIVRYLSNLKTTAALQRNVSRAISFLLGKERFIGRDPIY